LIERIDFYQGCSAADAFNSAIVLEWFLWKLSETRLASGSRPAMPQPEEDCTATIMPAAMKPEGRVS